MMSGKMRSSVEWSLPSSLRTAADATKSFGLMSFSVAGLFWTTTRFGDSLNASTAPVSFFTEIEAASNVSTVPTTATVFWPCASADVAKNVAMIVERRTVRMTSWPCSLLANFDLVKFGPAAGAALDGNGGSGAAELLGHEFDQLRIRLAIHWRCLQMREPRSVERLLQCAHASVWLDSDLDESGNQGLTARRRLWLFGERAESGEIRFRHGAFEVDVP